MKQNLEFYQHFIDADQHPKFKMLRIKYGWAGDGKFWALNNKIAASEQCRIDTSKKYIMATIAADLEFTMTDLLEFIDYLAGDCELIIKENGFITTEIVQENFERVHTKRIKNQEDYKNRIKETLRNVQASENEIQTSELIQTKLNKTKTKLKEKNTSSEKTSFSAEAHSLAITFLNTLDEDRKARIKAKDLLNWKKSIDSLLKEYQFEQIESVIKKIRVDDFWRKNFLSPCKLENKNKEGVKYMEVFLARVKSAKPPGIIAFRPGTHDPTAYEYALRYFENDQTLTDEQRAEGEKHYLQEFIKK